MESLVAHSSRCAMTSAGWFRKVPPMRRSKPQVSCSKVLSKNIHLRRWVDKMVALCKPERVHWVDGSKAEYDRLCDQMVGSGTFIRLNQKKWPGCFYAKSDPDDVARVEERTFI
jgi:GTP-dependent phosphoenolpyruvate carboxykinase